MIEINQPDPFDLNGKRLMKITGKLWVRKKKYYTKEHLVTIFSRNSFSNHIKMI
jgi:hypothetical protein